MNARAFLIVLSELNGTDHVSDWVNATNARIYAEWTRLLHSPLNLFVDEHGRIALEGFSQQAVNASEPLSFAIPSRTTADAMALVHTLGQQVCEDLGVQDTDPDEYTGHPECAKLTSSVDEANEAAARNHLPIRFVKALSPAKAWEMESSSGETFGMDDPIWMSKTQEAIDASLQNRWSERSARIGRYE
ncbi:hypothetical protein [Noviherbaspirillum denitrificans]|uniref:Uncharacterized protein n=1 Tax=Noviherbaspirillum denitrificans TaxID=1968433 RepID=A0A254T6Q6_9BURK|nr:hypothetical protein [Noviherbaspirillum denitrificans]OWW18349.1 hypothetical protein AYR66_02575 [Noviherbaspirillum denitrificans]